MKRAEILESLIKERGYHLKAFAAKCNIPYTTLYGIMKNGVGKAGVDNVYAICRHLDITLDDLQKMSGYTLKESALSPSAQIEQLILDNKKTLSPEERMSLIHRLSEPD